MENQIPNIKNRLNDFEVKNNGEYSLEFLKTLTPENIKVKVQNILNEAVRVLKPGEGIKFAPIYLNSRETSNLIFIKILDEVLTEFMNNKNIAYRDEPIDNADQNQNEKAYRRIIQKWNNST